MNVIQISSAAVCISILALCVKGINREAGRLISVAAAVVLVIAVVPMVGKIVSAVREMATYSPLGKKYVKPVLKITGIAYVTQIGAQLCRDSGEEILASRLEMAGKLAILTITLPIAKEAFIKTMEILT